MCISPIRIKNPNLGLTGPNAQFKDTTSQMIDVPCGVCAECVAARQLQYVQRLQMEELVNHLFFCTLTYNNESLPHVVTSTGYSIRYADVADVQRMMKRLRKRNAFGRPFRYFAVSELGSEKGRPHFHILFIVPKHEDDRLQDCMTLEKVMFDEVLKEWKRNVAPPVWSEKRGKFIPNTRHPVYRPLCTYVRKYVRGKLRTNYDLHYVNPTLSSGGSADVAFYVLKYMMKPSNRVIRLQQALHLNLDEDEYNDLWSLVRPRHFESEALGLGLVMFDKHQARSLHRRRYEVAPKIMEHLRRGIELSKRQPGEPMPSYFSPIDGQPRPLAKYYKSNGDIYTMMDFLDFFYASKKIDADNVIIKDDVPLNQLLKKESDFDDKVKNVQFQQTALELDDVFEDLDDEDFNLYLP